MAKEKKGTFYFSHDYNARTDDKIKKLIRKHGFAGYGIYWSIIEDLYNNANTLETDYNGIAYDMRENEETIKSVINDFGLFAIEDGFFGSLSVQSRLDVRDEKSKKAIDSANKRWGKVANAQNNNANAQNNNANAQNNNANANRTQIERKPNAMRTESESNAIKESKVKESKVKETKVKETKVNESKEKSNTDSNDLVKLELFNCSEEFIKNKARQCKISIQKVKQELEKFWTNTYDSSDEELKYNDVKRHFGYWLDKQDFSHQGRKRIQADEDQEVDTDTEEF
jgi:flagellar biosynthesis GTPase FlhF